MLFWLNGMLKVGPDSAAAHPGKRSIVQVSRGVALNYSLGPACYRKGGPLTVTDANLLLGRIVVSEFPHSKSSFTLMAILQLIKCSSIWQNRRPAT